MLPLTEEFVLLSLDGSPRRVSRAVELAHHVRPELPGYRDARLSLQHRGLLVCRRLRRSRATAEARVGKRRERILGLIRRQEPLGHTEAELLVMLAWARVLDLRRGDHLRARHRIASIGDDGSPPEIVDAVRMEIGAGSAQDLAVRLLPPKRYFAPGDFDPGVTAGVDAAGIGGATHHGGTGPVS